MASVSAADTRASRTPTAAVWAPGLVTTTTSVVSRPIAGKYWVVLAVAAVPTNVCSPIEGPVESAAGVRDTGKVPTFQRLPTGLCTVSGTVELFGPGFEPSMLVTAGNAMCAP